jgi:NAD(P)-dependent dehydrogenase (short-subunit alcohol dehydrogenase family)
MKNFAKHYRALVFGASGGIGGALADALTQDPGCETLIRLGRGSAPRVDIEDEATIASAAAVLAAAGPFDLMIDATGALTLDGFGPEKRLADLNPSRLLRAFAVNAVGPALLLKHFAALLPRQGRCIFGTLSARVGSIGDNRLGGWYGYRASKAALNQLWTCAAIEVARTRPASVLLCLHPGTVATGLSRPFLPNESADTPATCARQLLSVMDSATQTAQFLDQNGHSVPW